MEDTSFTWNLPAGLVGTSTTNVIVANGANSGSGVVSVSILTGCGSTPTLSSKTVSVNNCTAIKQLSANSELMVSLYPNPANDFIKINPGKEGNYTISISDMTGRLIVEEKWNKKILDVRDLKSGMYFITVRTDTGRQKTLKFLKE